MRLKVHTIHFIIHRLEKIHTICIMVCILLLAPKHIFVYADF